MNITNPIPNNGGDWIAKYGEAWKKQVEGVRAKFGAAVEEVRFPREQAVDVPVLYVKKESIVEILAFLKSEPGFEYNFLSDLTATDEEVEPRFEIAYNLFSHSTKARFRVKVRVAEGEEVPTAIPVWTGADWAEREVFDMFGVHFKGHPNLRRILMDARWEGHPLRKDYPLRGYQIFSEPEPIHTELLD